MLTKAKTKIDLWAGQRIPVVLISGAVNSGKTLFGLLIDPNCRRPKSEVEPTTILWDQEGSADSYEAGLNFTHKDTRAGVAMGAHRQIIEPSPDDPRWLAILKKQADSPAAAMFRAWYLCMLGVEPGRYELGICDTFTPLQDGMVDWLRRHPESFGRTINEYTRASSMFLWPDVKAMLSHILAIDCRLRFQTFVMNVHLKNEWTAGAKTGKLIAEGLDVLEKLATLHLELDRKPREKGKDAPRVPSAIVKKERLVRFSADGNDSPILPPRIPECTPDAIRKYIASPPDFAKLKVEERLPDSSMTGEEQLRMQAMISENNRVAEESRLSVMELARAAMQRGLAAGIQEAITTTVRTDSPAPAAAADLSAPLASVTQLDQLFVTMKKLFSSGEFAVKWLRKKFNVVQPCELDEKQAEEALMLTSSLPPPTPMPRS